MTITRDLDQAELERCDVFSDFSASEDRAYFEVPDDRWQAMLASWRIEHPGEAAAVDHALAPYPKSSDVF
jgi:hypothetical protein